MTNKQKLLGFFLPMVYKDCFASVFRVIIYVEKALSRLNQWIFRLSESFFTLIIQIIFKENVLIQ